MYLEFWDRTEKVMGDKNWKDMFDSMWKREGNSFIQFLLDAGLDVNTLNKHGTTILSYAAECGNLEIAEFLVQKGADANIANSDGSKPLHIAAHYCRKDLLNFFLNRGIAVDSCDNDKCTPLHYIAAKSDISSAGRESCQEIVQILVDRNADLDAVNGKGCTPLLIAAKNHRKHNVELFIKLGTNLENCDENQWTILHHACQKGWSGIVQTLVEGRFDIDLNRKTSEGNTPVIIAADYLHKDIVKMLIESRANVKCKSFGDKTLLHTACQSGWFDMVKSLVSEGCDLNAKNSRGETPFFMAANYSKFQASDIEYLIECGGDVKCSNEDGWALLHTACRRGWFDMVKSLVSKGCDLNAKNSREETPFFMAARLGNLEIVKHFIEKGAYFQTMREYIAISENSLLKEGILQNTQLCTVALMNKFNNADLPKIYNIPLVSGSRLPRIEKLKNTCQSMAQDITESVKYEMHTKGYCNVLNVHPIVLRRLCVLTLVKHYYEK